jgi:hypothetical protein
MSFGGENVNRGTRKRGEIEITRKKEANKGIFK